MKENTNADMNEYWNGDGGRDWIRFQDCIDKALIPFGQRAIAAAKLLPNDRVLDIGCGCGDTSLEISRQIEPHGRVLGIDISDLILERARIKEAAKSLSGIIFEHADAQVYDFEKKFFDVVFSRYGVMFFDNPEAAFKNIRQSLKPSGHMAFICWQPVSANQWVSLPLDIASKYVPLSEPPDPESPGGFSFGDANRVKRILSSAGFINISIEHFKEKFNVGKDLDEAVGLLSSIGPASTIISTPEVDEDTRLKFVSTLRDRLKSYMTPDGIKLDAATWVVTANNP